MSAFQKLGIDGASIVFYVVNYGIVLFVVHRYVIKPVSKALEQRRSSIKKQLSEVEELRKSFEKERSKLLSEAQKQAEEQRAEAQLLKTQAERQVATLLASAQKDRDELITKTQAELAEQKATLIAQTEKELLGRIGKIVQHVSQQESLSSAVEQSITSAWKELRS